MLWCMCVCVGRWVGVMLVNATFNNISVNSFDYFYKLQKLFFLNNYLPAFNEHTFKTSNKISPNISIFNEFRNLNTEVDICVQFKNLSTRPCSCTQYIDHSTDYVFAFWKYYNLFVYLFVSWSCNITTPVLVPLYGLFLWCWVCLFFSSVITF